MAKIEKKILLKIRLQIQTNSKFEINFLLRGKATLL